ncbi:MAG: hypothetical protein MN733_35355 [Nitrososphaera sp.]|nr:hypothetical protein [Nitrososphaera sp.]
MSIMSQLKRPSTFEKDAKYLLIQDASHDPKFQRVELVDYAACPALMIIRDERGKVRYCLRDELFLTVADSTQTYD